MTQKERSARHYRNRKDNGLCPRCGKKLDREGHYCSDCLEKINLYHRQNRIFYKKYHICAECGREHVFGTDRNCPECRAKKNERKEKMTDEQKKRYEKNFRQQQNFLYQQRKEQGICTRCGRRNTMPGRTKCGICLTKDAEAHRTPGISRSERPSYGFCYTCGEPLDRNGGLCRKCAESRAKTLPKNRDNKSWRNDNRLIFKN